MPCTVERGPGGILFLCSRARAKAPKCSCGRKATRLCDFPVEDGTCDRPICDRCSVQIGDPVTRLDSDPLVRAATINRLVDVHGEPFAADYEDTVDHCPEHAR